MPSVVSTRCEDLPQRLHSHLIKKKNQLTDKQKFALKFPLQHQPKALVRSTNFLKLFVPCTITFDHRGGVKLFSFQIVKKTHGIAVDRLNMCRESFSGARKKPVEFVVLIVPIKTDPIQRRQFCSMPPYFCSCVFVQLVGMEAWRAL